MLAVGAGRRLDACIDEDAAARCPQVGTVATAAAAEADEAQPLAQARVSGLGGVGLALGQRQLVGRIVTVHVKGDFQRASVIGISFIFMSWHYCGVYWCNRKMVGTLW